MVIGMFLHVFLPQKIERDMLALHLLLKIRQQFLEHLETLVRVCRVAALEARLKHGDLQFEKTVYAEFIGKGLSYVVVCGLFVDADNIGCLAVGGTLLLQEQ